MMTRSVLSLLLLLKASTFSSASVAIAESKCTNFTFPEEDGGDVRELCFSIRVLGPPISITTLPNGTDITEYVGGSSETYTFEGNLDGLTTEITWDDAEESLDCVAVANGEECSSCTLCDDGVGVSADCSNLEQGEQF